MLLILPQHTLQSLAGGLEEIDLELFCLQVPIRNEFEIGNDVMKQ